jgi:hypothetical protein
METYHTDIAAAASAEAVRRISLSLASVSLGEGHVRHLRDVAAPGLSILR